MHKCDSQQTALWRNV